jgi:dethiobiotin synthetase
MKIFITGTDTNIGKTYITTHLLHAFNQKGLKTLGLKPIASGATLHQGQLQNEDARTIMQASSIKNTPYEMINPFVYQAPIAPHIAAQKTGTPLTLNLVKSRIEHTLSHVSADVYVIEGVGGWSVPLNEQHLMSDLVRVLQIPVILVVGIKLGCLNHAILTAESITRSNVPFMGWIANCVALKASVVNENIEFLQSFIQAPYLGTVTFNQTQCFHSLSTKLVKSSDVI